MMTGNDIEKIYQSALVARNLIGKENEFMEALFELDNACMNNIPQIICELIELCRNNLPLDESIYVPKPESIKWSKEVEILFNNIPNAEHIPIKLREKTKWHINRLKLDGFSDDKISETVKYLGEKWSVSDARN